MAIVGREISARERAFLPTSSVPTVTALVMGNQDVVIVVSPTPQYHARMLQMY